MWQIEWVLTCALHTLALSTHSRSRSHSLTAFASLLSLSARLAQLTTHTPTLSETSRRNLFTVDDTIAPDQTDSARQAQLTTHAAISPRLSGDRLTLRSTWHYNHHTNPTSFDTAGVSILVFSKAMSVYNLFWQRSGIYT